MAPRVTTRGDDDEEELLAIHSDLPDFRGVSGGGAQVNSRPASTERSSSAFHAIVGGITAHAAGAAAAADETAVAAGDRASSVGGAPHRKRKRACSADGQPGDTPGDDANGAVAAHVAVDPAHAYPSKRPARESD